MTAKKGREGGCRLFLSDRALSDLCEIEAFSVSNWGKGVATKYILKFEKAFRLLEANPDLARPNPELGTDLLMYRVEKHLLVCIRIKEDLAVLTVAHASRDIESMLGDLTPTLRAEVKAVVKKIHALK